ncbi:MAG: amidohydrolase [Desulfobacterales bacterium]
MDPANPKGEWVAVGEGQILSIGNGRPPGRYHTPHTRILDLQGKAVLPGFIDAHLHFRALAESLSILSLKPDSGIRSITDIEDSIRRQTQTVPPGTWIRAGGYNEAYLTETRHPTRWDLDKAAPHHPVKLTHRSGHAHVLNSLGLTLTGITRETDEPPEGIIDRDMETGEPNGIFWGLNDFLSKKIPPIDEGMLARGADRANHKLLSCGITSFQDASPRNDRSRWQWFEGLKADGRIKSRITMLMGLDGLKQHREEGFSTDIVPAHLSMGGVKIVIDETTGSLNPSREDLKEIILSIHEAGYQVALHAIETSAIEAAADAIAHALEVSPRKDHRHRIEHCSVCPPALVERITTLGVMVVTHPAFLYHSGDRYLKTVPDDQQPDLYPIGSLLRKGVAVAAASDAPIVDVTPLSGMYSAVTRMTETGKILGAEECISPYHALELYTLLAAMSAFEEETKGTLSPGKLADLVVLSDNPLAVPEETIKDIEVEMTIVGGEVVWAKGE